MISRHRKITILILGLCFLILKIAADGFGAQVPEGIPFAIAAIALFRFGRSLQMHSTATLRRFRMTPRTAIWLSAVGAFWYSTVIWIWWSRRSPTFPLFLLNGELRTTLYFDWVIVAVMVGLTLEERAA